MNRLKWIILSAFLLLFLLVLIYTRRPKHSEPQVYKQYDGVAVIMTGAAARIPQEAALLEELYNRGLLKNVVFISGVSSGALNAVMLNGILNGKITWKEYKQILFNLKNSDIFIRNGTKLPVNTEPARNLYVKVVEEKLGYHQIGDLTYMTEISITNVSDMYLKKRIYRMCSRKINEETDTTLSLVDIMMASSAFPVAFPSVRIKNVTTIPDVEYIDGGVGEDHIPYRALLEFENFRGKDLEIVYILSRKSDSIPKVSEELANLGIADRKVFDKIGVSLENILKKGIIRRLEAFYEDAPELKERTYVWIPDFQADFPFLSFDNLKEQYDLTSQWAKTHDPVPLEEFLLPYRNKEKDRKK